MAPRSRRRSSFVGRSSVSREATRGGATAALPRAHCPDHCCEAQRNVTVLDLVVIAASAFPNQPDVRTLNRRIDELRLRRASGWVISWSSLASPNGRLPPHSARVMHEGGTVTHHRPARIANVRLMSESTAGATPPLSFASSNRLTDLLVETQARTRERGSRALARRTSSETSSLAPSRSPA